MTRKFLHEEQYRGAGQLAKLAEPQLVLCGAGAIGSLLADNLARQGFRKLRVIDRDRVEEHNISTQLYGAADIGALKAGILRNILFRSVEVEIEAVSKELNLDNARRAFQGADLVIDMFDNSLSRALVKQTCDDNNFECLHVGLSADYGEVIWNEDYRVPEDVTGDVCEYPLARNLVLLAVAIASEIIVEYVLNGAQRSVSATLGDFAVRELEAF